MVDKRPTFPSPSVFSSDEVCGDAFLGNGFPLMGPFPLSSIGGSGGGCEPLSEEMATRGGGKPSGAAVAVGDVGGLC